MTALDWIADKAKAKVPTKPEFCEDREEFFSTTSYTFNGYVPPRMMHQLKAFVERMEDRSINLGNPESHQIGENEFLSLGGAYKSDRYRVSYYRFVTTKVETPAEKKGLLEAYKKLKADNFDAYTLKAIVKTLSRP